MEYVFGAVRQRGRDFENLKTVGPVHSDLKGICHVERAYPDSIEIDDFRIVRKYHSDDNGESCFDWYEITDHSHYVDKFTPAQGAIETGISDSQDALCILSEDVELRLSEIEDALCELSKE